MAPNDRQERRLLRQRGAGTREIKNADFGFSFAPSNPPNAAPTAPPLNPRPSARKTPRNRETGGSARKAPATAKASATKKTPATAQKTPATATKTKSTRKSAQKPTAQVIREDPESPPAEQNVPQPSVPAPEPNDDQDDVNQPDPLTEDQGQVTPGASTRRTTLVHKTPLRALDQDGEDGQTSGQRTLNKRPLRSATAKSTGKRYQVVPSEPLPAVLNGRLSLGSTATGKARASMGGGSFASSEPNVSTPVRRKSMSRKGKENAEQIILPPPSVERGRRRTRLPLEDLEETVLLSPTQTEGVPAPSLGPSNLGLSVQPETPVEESVDEGRLEDTLRTPMRNEPSEQADSIANSVLQLPKATPLFVTPGPRTPAQQTSAGLAAGGDIDLPEAITIVEASDDDELDKSTVHNRRSTQQQYLNARLEGAVTLSPAMSAMSTLTDPTYQPEARYIPRKRRSDVLPEDPAPKKRQQMNVQVELQPPSREPSPDPVSMPPGTSIPITTHRLANAPSNHAPQTPVTAPEVLAQVTSELTQRLLATHLAIQRPATGPAAHARKSNILRAFDSTLQTTLFELSEAAYTSDVLEMRLRRARADLALRREELMTVRREREKVALRMDEVRSRFSRAEKDTMRRRDLVQRWERVGFALDQVREAGGEQDGERLSLRLRDVAARVCGKKSDGLLGKLKEFNVLLERAAEVIEKKGR